MKPHETRNFRELQAALVDGGPAEYLFFWGHKSRDVVDKSCLSNWYPSPFVVAGTTFQTTEHYMMWGKALLFDDTEMAERIVAAAGPREAKTLGRKVRGFDDKVWKENRFEIVTEGNLAKFAAHVEMGDFLLSTENAVLVEASPYDKIWGIGMRESHADARNPERWRGANNLGFVLMEVRARLVEARAK